MAAAGFFAIFFAAGLTVGLVDFRAGFGAGFFTGLLVAFFVTGFAAGLFAGLLDFAPLLAAFALAPLFTGFFDGIAAKSRGLADQLPLTAATIALRIVRLHKTMLYD